VTAHVYVPYPASNSSVRARALDWIDRLDRSGRIDRDDVLLHGPGFAGGRLAAADCVLLLRNARRVTRGGVEQRLLRRAQLGVYDIDDGLPWDDGRLPGLGRWWKRPFPRALVAERAARAADRVIVGNDVLAEWASTRAAEIVVIPTCVEPDDYEVRTAWHLDGRPPTIGWIGSPATEPYLHDIAESLAHVHRRTGARLEVISGPGTNPPAMAPFAARSAWTPESTRRIAAWDVGIMPLRDGVYERAKCGYKLLQYAASGVPAVGSPVGINRQLLTEMDAPAASSPDEWVESLVELLSEPAGRRRQRARRGLELAARYSYAAWESTWVSAVGW
jgi:hypothetical protein